MRLKKFDSNPSTIILQLVILFFFAILETSGFRQSLLSLLTVKLSNITFQKFQLVGMSFWSCVYERGGLIPPWLRRCTCNIQIWQWDFLPKTFCYSIINCHEQSHVVNGSFITVARVLMSLVQPALSSCCSVIRYGAEYDVYLYFMELERAAN